MTHSRYLLTSVDGGVGILQLNHPEKKNALGWEVHNEIIDALEQWAEDDEATERIRRSWPPET